MRQIITSDAISNYIERYSSAESDVLAALNRDTQEIPGAQMISGHLQGRLLQMISTMVKPKNVLELGTYTGYSAICLAQGLQKGGFVHTIDRDPSIQDLRNKYWKKAGLQHIIKQHIGDASSLIDKLPVEDFDLVFIDADKKNYGLYFDMLTGRLPIGAFILADNVLYSGEVILAGEKQSKNAIHMHTFNQKIATDDRVEQVILPVRDGLTIMRKI